MAYREIPLLVRGGELRLGVTTQDNPDVPVLLPVSLSFVYEGVLPRDLALELVRQTPDDGTRINGKTVLEFLESL